MGKKIVNSNCPEFGYELLSAVPYAYNLYLKGELESTISAYDTSCLYFFSPKHTESGCMRSWDNMRKLWNTNFPNINIHRNELDWDSFSAPPFKEFYKDKSISFEKETLVIFNRYNYEWGKPPLNFLDIPTLTSLFNMLQDKYQIVYINIKGHKKYYDGVDPMDLGDDELLKKYPKVISINGLIDKHPDLTYNEIQLRVFANCEKYISSNGGQLILSAYFGGENIIFSKYCRELGPNINSFYRWYNKLGDGVFQHVDNYKDLIQLVKEKWVENKPMINILVRTSGRPKYFDGCINSIYNQTYKNWNIIVGVDDNESKKYVQPTKSRMIQYDYHNLKKMESPKGDDYGIYFTYNLYLNDLQNEVKYGYIMYLDDDDALYDNESLMNIVNNITNEDEFLMWRVKFPDRLVPSDKNFGNEPVIRDISGIGYAFHHKHKIDWEPFKRGDYRVAKKLYGKIPKKIYINKPLTKLQRQVEDGFGRRDDKFTVEEIITDFKEIDNNQFKSGKIKSSLEVTKKELNYDKINQIFAGQKHNPTVINRPTTISQPQPKTNSEMIQKLMGKKRNR
jgi:glycosyltransferase involved in cell wall biosynthesis